MFVAFWSFARSLAQKKNQQQLFVCFDFHFEFSFKLFFAHLLFAFSFRLDPSPLPHTLTRPNTAHAYPPFLSSVSLLSWAGFFTVCSKIRLGCESALPAFLLLFLASCCCRCCCCWQLPVRLGAWAAVSVGCKLVLTVFLLLYSLHTYTQAHTHTRMLGTLTYFIFATKLCITRQQQQQQQQKREGKQNNNKRYCNYNYNEKFLSIILFMFWQLINSFFLFIAISPAVFV